MCKSLERESKAIRITSRTQETYFFSFSKILRKCFSGATYVTMHVVRTLYIVLGDLKGQLK